MSARPHAATLEALRQLPKAELHLHLEGAVRPRTLVELAARHGEALTLAETVARYEYDDFLGFLEAFKWVASYLREPEDFAFITEKLVDEFVEQNVVYAEVIFAAGVMIWRGQSVEANLTAMRRAAEAARKRGVWIRWAPDITRQFGGAAALRVAQEVVRLKDEDIASFGMGGDELSFPAEEFRPAFDYAAEHGLRCTCHAGEVGGPNGIRDAIALLHAERIGHGIAAMHDAALQQHLKERQIALEICPWSNIRTGALAKQLSREATIVDHPLKSLYDSGVPVTISTDDPAMFHTDLPSEYAAALGLGLSPVQLAGIVEGAMKFAFVDATAKSGYFARSGRARQILSLA